MNQKIQEILNKSNLSQLTESLDINPLIEEFAMSIVNECALAFLPDTWESGENLDEYNKIVSHLKHHFGVN